MNYGLYLSASGLLSAMHRMDVAANNLANVNTAGFKPDFAAAAHRPAERVEDGLYHIDSNTLLDRLGGGALSAPTLTRFASAPPEVTDNPLDVAILGEGFFVLDSAGDGSGDDVKFSRDGRLTLDADGVLVQAATGRAVLDDGDSPIRLDPALPVEITAAGAVRQGDRTVATIQIAAPPDLTALRKVGENLYRAPRAMADARRATGSFVQPGAVEGSAADPIRALMGATDAGRAVTMNTRLVDLADALMDRAINTFGFIA
ncbi:MAG: flagellar hook basal-body protein [Planctomycetota bacterium]|nr:MAG: flagellar hook basal-body protein [Planctomycetota bacterium]